MGFNSIIAEISSGVSGSTAATLSPCPSPSNLGATGCGTCSGSALWGCDGRTGCAPFGFPTSGGVSMVGDSAFAGFGLDRSLIFAWLSRSPPRCGSNILTTCAMRRGAGRSTPWPFRAQRSSNTLTKVSVISCFVLAILNFVYRASTPVFFEPTVCSGGILPNIVLHL
ncbi:MAG: hypothetical protein BWY09_02938 [Candidatus Hydrogenedentes bacterium ADurb.Bin179]|nr:MAG: hypothetical protein BWY09_02938 [Candidatus Hydrogenedentes bacterium ADurb.Bin179]